MQVSTRRAAGREARLFELLADGRFHSGEAIARTLGVSRAAVWKNMQRLRALGGAIDAVRGRGYRSRYPIEALSAESIAAHLDPLVQARLDRLDVVTSIDSTNAALLGEALSDRRVLFAEHQRCGRGRRGRRWESPWCGGLYLSLRWVYTDLPSGPGALALLVGVALADTLEALGYGAIGVKWPNDLIRDGRKLGGVLIELAGDPTGTCRLVIGVGINWQLPPALEAELDQPATGLMDTVHTARLPGRNQVAAALIDALVRACHAFPADLDAALAERWPRRDVLYGREITIRQPSGFVTGRMAGIDREGALLLDTPVGQQRFYSGDIRVRLTE
ncbi:biotin--[acetyl-CoA-carboxylase] ligase [Nitrococcus mobilis]|uniref:Bifunctional ligase/repressor BirA n=1 Tax=Nitrococcus mobilis Nb-231 TaxID=314278 RepID=A4BL48_9GAMM|nr:biotin--[acetyl-CoA-carboxylase] ligase [Nitrococcus mobilis]EAR23036.1 biotin--protein ligase [Nitrococcus mobilis Nb-231]